MRLSLPGLLLAMLLTTGQAVAQNDPGAPGVAVAKGICSRLITGADDYTEKCDAQAASVTLDDGTIMFVFSIEGTPVGFSGDGHAVTRGFGGAGILPVDFVSLGANAELGAFQAEGTCLFGDPYSGPANIWCVAVTEAGPFVATFKTDGSPPVEAPD